jgi:UDP-N-acetylglucosamine 3-dehydrogenase
MALRAALIGAGMMGKNHARVLSSLEGVDFVAVVDELGDPHGIRGGAALLSNLEELSSLDIDFAVVATPTSTHEDIATWLFGSVIHAFIEKPVSTDAPSAQRILESCQKSGLQGAVGHIERFNPAIRELKNRLLEGEIGDVFQIATRRQGSFPSRIGDVGVTKDLATHDIDLTMWVSNSDYSLVFAQSAHRSGRAHEDMISVSGRLVNGVIVNHVVNWLSPMKERVVVVTGDKGTFVADTLTGDLTLHENGAFTVDWESFATFRGVTEGNVTRFAYPKREPLRSELEGFRDAIARNGDDYVSLAEGVRVVEVADAVLTSSETGTVQFL